MLQSSVPDPCRLGGLCRMIGCKDSLLVNHARICVVSAVMSVCLLFSSVQFSSCRLMIMRRGLRARCKGQRVVCLLEEYCMGGYSVIVQFDGTSPTPLGPGRSDWPRNQF